VLGVKIGQVNKITPTGRTVRIEMSYDAKYKIPAPPRPSWSRPRSSAIVMSS